jgi:hypothetical protein
MKSKSPRTEEMCRGSEWCPRYKVVEMESELNEATRQLKASDALHREAIIEIYGANQVATDNRDWFESLVNDLAEILGCAKKPAAIIDAAKQCRADREKIRVRRIINPEDVAGAY